VFTSELECIRLNGLKQTTEAVNMETYIQVSFWLGVAALVINMLLIAAVDYPKAKVETLGQKIFQIIIGGAFVVWSGFLLFGN
jgi:hypothetical protein